MKNHKRGFALLLGIIVIATLIILSASQFDRVTNFVRFGNNKVLEQQAINSAEAGLEYSIWQLNENAGSWYGTGTEIPVGTIGTFFTTVTDEGNFKTIVSTGYIPDSVNPRKQIAIKAQAFVGSETISFNYAVQVGTGGIEMDNSSTINGNAYSNATGVSITGGNGSTITGDAFAVGTIDSPPTVSGSINENQEPSQMPSVDYQFWRDAAAVGGTTICSPTCNISGSGNIGPEKYEGNLYFNGGAIYTIQGPIHVTGDLVLDNNVILSLDESFGSNGTVLIADGKIFVDNNAQILPTNATPKGYVLVVTTSTADTNQVNCEIPSVSSNAICIDNNGVTAVFYALEGGATLDNNAGVYSLVSKKLFLDNNAELNYQSGLASAQFSTGPGGSYSLRKGSYQYTK